MLYIGKYSHRHLSAIIKEYSLEKKSPSSLEIKARRGGFHLSPTRQTDLLFAIKYTEEFQDSLGYTRKHYHEKT